VPFGSRRACELIAAGRAQINGRKATLGDRVDPSSDEVRVDGAKVNIDPELRTFALHKPRDVTTTMRDPHAERDLTRFLPKGVHVFPVGRLDRDTEGLLLLTNDGALAHRLTHPRYAIEKEYLAEVDRPPSNRQLSRLRRGVELDDGIARAVDARSAGGARGRGGAGGRGGVRLVMVEGRKREVRRMLDAIGLPVRRRWSARSGRADPSRAVAPGDVEERPEDVRALYRVAGL
jgi:23S rRNA pseudouridine2605 synthase